MSYALSILSRPPARLKHGPRSVVFRSCSDVLLLLLLLYVMVYQDRKILLPALIEPHSTRVMPALTARRLGCPYPRQAASTDITSKGPTVSVSRSRFESRHHTAHITTPLAIADYWPLLVEISKYIATLKRPAQNQVRLFRCYRVR
jgi:hypothetical protein